MYIDDLNHAAVLSGLNADSVSGTTDLADGRWHFIAGVYEGPSTNVVRVYVDDALDIIGSISRLPTVSGAYTIDRFLDGSGYFAGLMDELIVYNRAITAEEVVKYYNKDLGRVAYWRMENNWEDSSGNNNFFTASGGPGFNKPDAKVGAAAGSFNGSNQYVSNFAPVNLNITTNFTITGWSYPKAAQWGGIIDRGLENTGG